MRTWMSGLLALLLAQGAVTVLLLAGLPDPGEAWLMARNMAFGLFVLGGVLCVMTESTRSADALAGRGDLPVRRLLRHVPLTFDVQTALRLMAAALLWLVILNALRLGE
ncbi:hypothetical protein [Leeia aquatica]|uniref:Uncharacterized protein n=1 Tax=Leeia aquatica TaxID=2725557 RepID=A0A847SAL9_9NEIS|nr:hypothetical protein [Leeia aquatica]NLR75967.1 hypothetical protein [Leeia aquatica]